MEAANQGWMSRQLEVVRMPFSGVVILYMNKNDQTMRSSWLGSDHRHGSSW